MAEVEKAYQSQYTGQEIDEAIRDVKNLPTSGTAAMAKKLETAREIGLTGAVTGSAEFDGSGNAIINTKRRCTLIGPHSGNNTYYKVASLIIAAPYHNEYITFLVSNNYDTAVNHLGILSIAFRTNKVSNYENSKIQWLCCTNGINKDDFILCYKNETNKVIVEIYQRVSINYETWLWTVLKEGTRTTVNDSWNLVSNVTSDMALVNLPEGYTQVPSTYSNLNTGEINSLGLNMRKDPSGTISYPIYFYAGTNGEKLIKINSGQATVNNIVYPTLAIRCSTDNGATWTVIGNFINSDAISKPYDVVTKGYTDAQYLKNTGGTLNGNLVLSRNGTSSCGLILQTVNGSTTDLADLRFFSGTNSHIWVQGKNPNDYKTTFRNLREPVQSTEPATKNYVDTQLAALEAKLTGKTVAEVMTANAVAASIPNEAPTLEAPGEEEITV